MFFFTSLLSHDRLTGNHPVMSQELITNMLDVRVLPGCHTGNEWASLNGLVWGD